MLMLVLEAGKARYGVSARSIVEVLPAPAFRPLPGTPAWVTGVFSYHGEIVPVIDVSALLTGRPAPALLSTRTILVSFRPLCADRDVLLGLLAEHVTETITCSPEELRPTGVRGSDAPYAGRILVRAGNLIQELHVDRLLTAELQGQLFREAAAPV